MIDVDHFKTVNDRFGHLSGDKILSQIAHVCTEQMRNVGQLAHSGGEEFAAILPHTHLTEATNIAERLRASVKENIELPNGEMIKDDTSEEDIIRRADEALYQAKTKGRNRVIVLS